ncbi:MAG: DEAD/DEAH box helicase [Burkholderiaceae bacterium]|nr:DEAD/DEAH box helicase [Burkholderiaceae bacterium]
MASFEENNACAQEQQAQTAIESEATQNGFEALGLAPELLAAVADLGYTQPTAVQQRAIPLALASTEAQDGGSFNDLMVSSQTGSGKTAAFLLPVLHTLLRQQAEQAASEKAAWEARVAEALARGEEAPKKPRRKSPLNPRHFKPAVPGALVLCPTRELAQQVAQEAIGLVRHCRGLRVASVVGGMPYQQQVAKLQNANLLVATPGRLLDLQRSGQIVLDQVQFLVMDEADRMLDLGFADDLAAIHQLTAQRQQTMMFSATFAPRIQQLAMRVMHEGGARVQRLQLDAPHERHANIEQRLYWADHPDHRRALLDHWLRDPAIDQAIVFACTQIECEQLAEDLQQSGFAAVSLHGALNQGLRNRRLGALRDGRVQILVATDVAARGIDVPTITHVINYGLPMKAEDYTHRVGRTGRAGRDGLAVTLAEIRDRRRLADIEAHTRQRFQVHTIPGLEPQKPFPAVTGPSLGHGGRRGQGASVARGRSSPPSGASAMKAPATASVPRAGVPTVRPRIARRPTARRISTRNRPPAGMQRAQAAIPKIAVSAAMSVRVATHHAQPRRPVMRALAHSRRARTPAAARAALCAPARRVASPTRRAELRAARPACGRGWAGH